MKSLLTYLFASLLAIQVSGQCTNGIFWGFEENCLNPANAFFEGCIADASSSHGTPDNDLPSGNAPAPASNGGSRYAHMYSRFVGSCQNGEGLKGEGILLHFNFAATKTYRIRFTGRTLYPAGNNAQMRLILVTSADVPNATGIASPAGCAATDGVPAVPFNSQNVRTFGGSLFPNSSWGNFSTTVTPSANFDRLWFRPLLENVPDGWLNWYIDNVCIEELDCLPECIDLTTSAISGPTSLCTTADPNNTVNYSATMGNFSPLCPTPVWSVSPASGLQITGQKVTAGGVATLEVLPQTQGSYTISFTIFPCGSDPVTTTLPVVVCSSTPYTPISPPIALNYLCTSVEKCYTFPTDVCNTSYTLSTPDTKLFIDQTGSTICMSSLWFRKRTSPVFVTASNACGVGSTETWNIKIDFPEYCGGTPNPLSNPVAAEDRDSYSEAVPQSTLFPNPVSNSAAILQAGITTGESYTVTIYNATGQLVKTYSDVTDAALTIEQGTLQAGAHIVQVEFADGRQEILKLIVL